MEDRVANREGDDLLPKLKRWFESSEEANREAFDKMERDQDYYDGKQLTKQEYDTLVQRGQPPIVINLIRRKIDFLLGLEAQQRADPKAYPRTPMDAASAEVATDALRYIGDWNEYPYHRARAWRDILVTGIGGLQVDVRPSAKPVKPMLKQLGIMENNPDIVITRTPWDRMWWDSHSAEPDFSDCRHRGLVVWKDKDEAVAEYGPESESILQHTIDKASRTDIYDDKPRYRPWADPARKRVRIVQCYWKENGRCYWAEFTEQGILRQGESPWVDTDGEGEDPYIWRSAYVDRDNNRHGVVRDMIDPQDEVNKRRSKALHLLTMRQVIVDNGAVDDPEHAKRQLARPDGYIVKNPGFEFQIAENGDLTQGQMALLEHATAELEKMGPNASLQGTSEDAQSGRALQARQQGGMVELGQLLDHLRSMDRETYSKCWARAKQFWTAPQFIRITDREDAPEFVGLNEPMIDPQTGQVVGMQHNIGDLDIDLIIEEGPDVATIQQEVFEQFGQLLPTLVQLPPQMQAFAVEMSPLPSSKKKRLLDILQGGDQDPQQQAMQQQMQQAQQELQMASGQAQIAETAASAELKRAQAFKAAREAAGPPQLIGN